MCLDRREANKANVIVEPSLTMRRVTIWKQGELWYSAIVITNLRCCGFRVFGAECVI